MLFFIDTNHANVLSCFHKKVEEVHFMSKLYKFICIILTCILMLTTLSVTAFADDNTIGERIRFVPMQIVTENDKSTVSGYFVNLNDAIQVSNFTDFDMDLYYHSDLLLTGNLGNLKQFKVEPLGLTYETFTFDANEELTGVQDCFDAIYAPFGCEFSKEDSSKTGIVYGSSNDPGSDEIANRIRYLPTQIMVTKENVVVDGYFVNLNPHTKVGSFNEASMAVYLGGELLIDADFGTLNDFAIEPLSLERQTFTFQGDYTETLNEGTYNCDDSFYVLSDFTFSHDEAESH